MSLTTQSGSTMNITPNDRTTISTADAVQGPKQGNWTYDDYAAIPNDGKRYQIVEGVLFTLPAPNLGHQEIVGEIFVSLRNHIKLTGLGKVYMAPVDVELNPKTIVQPDILVVLTAHLDRISDKRIIGPPDLVVEVVSPGTAEFDCRQKQDAYTRAGVPEYWIADPGACTIELLMLEAGTYRLLDIFEGSQTLPSTVIPEFPARIEQFFA